MIEKILAGSSDLMKDLDIAVENSPELRAIQLLLVGTRTNKSLILLNEKSSICKGHLSIRFFFCSNNC